jgi:hypothetical protein
LAGVIAVSWPLFHTLVLFRSHTNNETGDAPAEENTPNCGLALTDTTEVPSVFAAKAKVVLNGM